MNTQTESQSSFRIITNNVPRDLIYGYELSEKERKEFDYLDWNDPESSEGFTNQFFRYRGQLYDIGEFLYIGKHEGWKLNMPNEFCKWDGYCSDSFFSGIVIRFPVDDCGQTDYERIIVGLYLC